MLHVEWRYVSCRHGTQLNADRARWRDLIGNEQVACLRYHDQYGCRNLSGHRFNLLEQADASHS